MNITDTVEKTILSLASVFAGWILAQVTGILRDRLKERKIRKCLEEELNDLLKELKRTKLIYGRALQIYGLKGIDDGVPTRLNNHVFKNYYKDAVLSLNANQRISFQMIDTLVESINDGINEIRRLGVELHTKHKLANSGGLSDEHGDLWGSTLKAEYTNVAAAEWHVRFHLENRRSPDLAPYTSHHEDYLKHLETVAREVDEAVTNSAKSLRREDFERRAVMPNRPEKTKS